MKKLFIPVMMLLLGSGAGVAQHEGGHEGGGNHGGGPAFNGGHIPEHGPAPHPEGHAGPGAVTHPDGHDGHVGAAPGGAPRACG